MSSMSGFIALVLVLIAFFLALKLLVLVLLGPLGFFGLCSPTVRPNSSSSYSDGLLSDDRLSDDPEPETDLGMDWEEHQRMYDLERL